MFYLKIYDFKMGCLIFDKIFEYRDNCHEAHFEADAND